MDNLKLIVKTRMGELACEKVAVECNDWIHCGV